ncbi:carboxymuconolactone decarboxylase family protein [Pseudomonas abietaniphila]|uniref:carboxymuconolactone decarboxylase family protein n=1 Tax=Pseudomonas abietaniphila TaxID=89065 RepID=UPI00321753E4
MSVKLGQSDFDRGLELLKRIGGSDFDGPVAKLAEVSKDMAELTVAFPYGQILSRGLLDLRTRQICTVSCLAAHGSAQNQLRFHMHGLLNAGGTPQDLVELMYLSTALIGFPTAINAIDILREIFKARSISYRDTPTESSTSNPDRYVNGLLAFERLMHLPAEEYVGALTKLSPEIAKWTMEFEFGDVFARLGLSPRDKHFIAICMLATVGNRQVQLGTHLKAALACGTTVNEISEVFIQLSAYAGFPTALNAFSVLSATMNEPHVPHDKSTHPPSSNDEGSSRMEKGFASLAATSGGSGEAVVRSFDDIAPDIGRMIVEHSYGDIFCRDGIDPKTRELTACAALAAKGTRTTETPLRVHVKAALKVGASKTELIETMLNLLPYCGYPAVQAALLIVTEEISDG